jgi:hypothetical protein
VERPKYEVSQIINRFGRQYIDQCQPNSFVVRTLDALYKCRTMALGGHKDVCDCCGEQRISYNSCGNRHCPKCQANKQALWVEDRMNDAICVLHTWGQNLSLHPHIHCIVPAAGLTLKGNLKQITKQGKYRYPVRMLSVVFRGKMLEKNKRQLKRNNQLPQFQSLIDDLWKKPWVVYCEPPMGNAQQIVKYLGQYTHRVAIRNQRIQNIDESGISFFFKDYKDNCKRKLTKLSGVEFLRRFCMHILPYRFVKIRYYGILSSKQKDLVKPVAVKKPEKNLNESKQERVLRLTGFDRFQCPFCKEGFMHTVELLPRIRSPDSFLYKTHKLIS